MDEVKGTMTASKVKMNQCALSRPSLAFEKAD
jgi:hypothetical protein